VFRPRTDRRPKTGIEIGTEPEERASQVRQAGGSLVRGRGGHGQTRGRGKKKKKKQQTSRGKEGVCCSSSTGWSQRGKRREKESQNPDCVGMLYDKPNKGKDEARSEIGREHGRFVVFSKIVCIKGRYHRLEFGRPKRTGPGARLGLPMTSSALTETPPRLRERNSEREKSLNCRKEPWKRQAEGTASTFTTFPGQTYPKSSPASSWGEGREPAYRKIV